MFTGIVEETGSVESIQPRSNAIRLIVRAIATAKRLKKGDSLAVNGCCLTAVGISGRGRTRSVEFDLLRETWERTNLHAVRDGSLVNLERALRAGDALGGHFVTGHIDGTGTITRSEQSGRDYVLEIAPPSELLRYLVFKGSVAVDGISLTVAAVLTRKFRIWIIPHTFEVTALKERKVGDLVNIETDILGKYVEKFLKPAARRARR